MIHRLILLLYFTPPCYSLFFGGGGGSNCPCACIPAPPPICSPPPICAQPSPCSSPVPAPLPSPIYLPGWLPASQTPPLYSTAYSSAPPPLLLPSSHSYVAPAPPISVQVLPAPIPIKTATYYLPPNLPLIKPVTLIPNAVDFVTPPYLQSGLAPAPTPYDKQFDMDSLEQMSQQFLEVPPPPPPSDDSETDTESKEIAPFYDYRTSEVSTVYKPGFSPPMQVMYMQEEGVPLEESTAETNYDKRHSVLSRMRNAKRESVKRTNSTCNSIKLANIMMRAIVEDVTTSKRMIQHATKQSFDGAKFDVFCASGEFSYSIHSRKYCEITKELITCFAFR